jgi:SAM-dependent methyltransferase
MAVMAPPVATIDAYNDESGSLADKYESRPFEDIHAQVIDLLPASPGLVLDIGAGSGRDAAWFADQGYEVTAVEPAQQMRVVARLLHVQPDITWLDDRLPELGTLMGQDRQFDLIWLSAVWMHVPQDSRQLAIQHLVSLLRPGGRIMITLREGPFPKNRVMYETSFEELRLLAGKYDLDVLRVVNTPDQLLRNEVSWQSVMLHSAV